MKKKKIFISLASLVGVCVVAFAIYAMQMSSVSSDTRIPLPIVNMETGDVAVMWGQDVGQGLFASAIFGVLNNSTREIHYFFDDEVAPFPIEADAPKDMISFMCSEGASTASENVFSGFHEGSPAWIWGPYVGDEDDRILAWIERGSDESETGGMKTDPDHPNHVFNIYASQGTVKWGGQGLTYADPSYAIGDGRYVASAAIPSGYANVQVRCSATNPTPACGDGWLESSECDDAGVDSEQCDSDCTIAECGDSHANAAAGEQCDGGGEDTASCDSDCTAVECGDGYKNAAAGEECDDSGDSSECDQDCTVVECGDGYVNTAAGEECDDAEDNGKYGFCNNSCTGQTDAVCGNGDVEGDEECDDGNNDLSDSCPSGTDGSCESAVCGDGFTWSTDGGSEECDDGDAVNENGCTNWCVAPTCGDGILSTGEGCDDGATCKDADGRILNCTANWTAGVLEWTQPQGCIDNTAEFPTGDPCAVQANDGCDASCNEETNFACPGESETIQVDGAGQDVLRSKCYFGAPTL